MQSMLYQKNITEAGKNTAMWAGVVIQSLRDASAQNKVHMPKSMVWILFTNEC